MVLFSKRNYVKDFSVVNSQKLQTPHDCTIESEDSVVEVRAAVDAFFFFFTDHVSSSPREILDYILQGTDSRSPWKPQHRPSSSIKSSGLLL